MTIKELKETIVELPDDMNVFIEFYDGWDTFLSHIKDYDIATEFGSDGYDLKRDCFYLKAKKID